LGLTERDTTDMIRTIVACVFLATAACAHASASEKYPVSPYAWELKVQRVGEVLFRYVIFFPDEYPCLRTETFDPTSLQLIDKKDICKIPIDRNLTLDVRKDVTAAYFEDPIFEESIFRFTADISTKRGPAYLLSCEIVISNSGKLSEPECHGDERPTEPE
jgi:hypothetical protein